MDTQKTKNRHQWIIWLIILIVALLLALWARSCKTTIIETGSNQLCFNSQYNTEYWGDIIILDSASSEKLFQNIQQTGTLNSLKDMECLEYLMILNYGRKDLQNISAIKELDNLKQLYLDNTAIEDIAPLAQLNNLETLFLVNTDISDINILNTLGNTLKHLSLAYTNVSDITILINFTNLEELTLNNTPITDLSPIYNLSGLKYLNLYDTAFSQSYFKTHINPLLDEQIKKLQTQNPNLIIRYAQFEITENNIGLLHSIENLLSVKNFIVPELVFLD